MQPAPADIASQHALGQAKSEAPTAATRAKNKGKAAKKIISDGDDSTAEPGVDPEELRVRSQRTHKSKRTIYQRRN